VETTITGSRITNLGMRGITLFALGMLYGLLVRHLHDERQLASFQVGGIIQPRNDWTYLAFWGVAGVALGSLLPWVDTFWEESSDGEAVSPIESTKKREDGKVAADWTPVVRSVGAFVGIAFAIVRPPYVKYKYDDC
jgi:hypothetical protein